MYLVLPTLRGIKYDNKSGEIRKYSFLRNFGNSTEFEGKFDTRFTNVKEIYWVIRYV